MVTIPKLDVVNMSMKRQHIFKLSKDSQNNCIKNYPTPFFFQKKHRVQNRPIFTVLNFQKGRSGNH